MKILISLIVLGLVATDANAVSRRGVQRANILQLIYPNGIPQTPAVPQPAPVVNPPVVTPTP